MDKDEAHQKAIIEFENRLSDLVTEILSDVPLKVLAEYFGDYTVLDCIKAARNEAL